MINFDYAIKEGGGGGEGGGAGGQIKTVAAVFFLQSLFSPKESFNRYAFKLLCGVLHQLYL